MRALSRPVVESGLPVSEADRRLRIAFGREVTKRILAGDDSRDDPGCADPRGLDEIRRALA